MRNTKIIAFASQKGGVGKTTLAGHLAVEAERQGAGPVALLDTDPQGSLAAWWNVRAAETPVFVRGELANLKSQLAQLATAGINLVLIDTPPAITENIAAVVRQADLVIIPTRPSPHDLRAVGATVDLVEGTGKPMLFVVNPRPDHCRRRRGLVAARHSRSRDHPPTGGFCRQHDRRPHGWRA